MLDFALYSDIHASQEISGGFTTPHSHGFSLMVVLMLLFRCTLWHKVCHPMSRRIRARKVLGSIISTKDVFNRENCFSNIEKLKVWNIPSHLKQLNPTYILRVILVVAVVAGISYKNCFTTCTRLYSWKEKTR